MRKQKKPEPILRAPAMTPREIEVLYLIGEGFSTKEIGDELGISARTAKKYSDDLRLKWRVKKKRQLIAIAWSYERGEIPL